MLAIRNGMTLRFPERFMTTSDFLDLKLARLTAFVGAGKGLRAAVYSALAHIRDFVLIESIDFNDAHL